MVRMNVKDAAKQLEALVERVERDGERIELEKDNRVVARIEPSNGAALTGEDFFTRLSEAKKQIGAEELEAMARDIQAARDSLAPLKDPWRE